MYNFISLGLTELNVYLKVFKQMPKSRAVDGKENEVIKFVKRLELYFCRA